MLECACFCYRKHWQNTHSTAIEVTKWVVEDLELPDDDYTLKTLVHLAARGYKFGFDEGIDL